MDLVVRGDYEQVGTFNGNPLTMAAARVALTEVLTDGAYKHFDELRELMVRGCEDVIEDNGLPAYVVALGAKGRVTFSPTLVRNYRDFLRTDERLSYGHWLFQFNGGVFLPPWGRSEQWMLSVQHSVEDVQRFVENLRAFAQALRS